MYEFVGVQRIDFVDKETGEPVQGFSLWFLEPSKAPGIGRKPFKHFVRDDRVDEFFGNKGVAGWSDRVGKYCTIIYNRYGKISELIFK